MAVPIYIPTTMFPFGITFLEPEAVLFSKHKVIVKNLGKEDIGNELSLNIFYAPGAVSGVNTSYLILTQIVCILLSLFHKSENNINNK